MPQNRKKLIDLLIGNVSNSIIHKILEKAAEDKELADRYNKQLTTSLEIAKKYREKINPIGASLPDKDAEYIKSRITNKVKNELMQRILKGYENIDLDSVEKFINEALKDTRVV